MKRYGLTAGRCNRSALTLRRHLLNAPTAPFPRVIRDASGASLVIPHKPQRIVSQTLGTDEILLAICAPQRLVALSILVDDADYSNVTAQAHLVKARANADAEQILALYPDVIFVASYSKAELIELLQAAHAPVFRFAHFDRLEDIKANIRTIGYAVGEDDNADALVQHMEHHLARDPGQSAQRPPTHARDVVRTGRLHRGCAYAVR